MWLWLFAFDGPPRCLRRAPQSRSGMGSRLLARGEAGCRSVQRQARDGLSLDPAPAAERRAPGHRASSFRDGPAQTPGRVRVKDIGNTKVQGHGLHLEGEIVVAFGAALVE